jgi:hypothetical protein
MKPKGNLCRHSVLTTGCRECSTVEDSGRRMAELINLKVICHPWDTICNSWMAFNLGTGDSDNVLYDTRKAAIDHQPEERWCCYFFMRAAMGGVKASDCQLYINLHRQVYEAGGRLAEPEAPSLIVSTRGYDIMRGKVNPRAN